MLVCVIVPARRGCLTPPKTDRRSSSLEVIIHKDVETFGLQLGAGQETSAERSVNRACAYDRAYDGDDDRGTPHRRRLPQFNNPARRRGRSSPDAGSRDATGCASACTAFRAAAWAGPGWSGSY